MIFAPSRRRSMVSSNRSSRGGVDCETAWRRGMVIIIAGGGA